MEDRDKEDNVIPRSEIDPMAKHGYPYDPLKKPPQKDHITTIFPSFVYDMLRQVRPLKDLPGHPARYESPDPKTTQVPDATTAGQQ